MNKDMEHLGEIGQHIFSRLTDRELAALTVASSGLAVLIDSQSQLFWYERARSLLGKLDLQKREGADWRLIYSDLATPNRKDYARGAFHLETMKVLLEAYPTSTLNATDIIEIRNAEVLEYLLDAGVVEYDPRAGLRAIVSNAVRSAVELTMKDYPVQAVLMVDALDRRGSLIGAAIMEDHPVREALLMDVLDERRISFGVAAARSALFYGHVDAFKNLTRNRPHLLDTFKNFKAAIEGENIASLQYIKSTLTKHELSMHERRFIEYAVRRMTGEQKSYPVSFRFLLEGKKMDNEELSRLYRQSGHHPSSEVLQVLLDKGLDLPIREWERLAVLAIESGDNALLTVALGQFNPTGAGNELLLLVKHPKVILANLPLTTRRLIYHKLLSLIENTSDYPIDELIDPPSTFWELVGYVLTKQPAPSQLLGYIREHLLNRREVREALASVFDETALYDEEVAPLRALFLFLIYPNMSLEESTNYLREPDKYSEDMIEHTNLLLRLIR